MGLVEDTSNESKPLAYLVNDLLRMINSNSNEIADDFAIINNTFVMLKDIEKMGVNEFTLIAKQYMPKKLYKYFPNKWVFEGNGKKPINYSLQSLRNNTVFLQSPDLFDDVYDSSITIDWLVYARIRLHEYLVRCGASDIDLDSSLEDLGRSLAKIFFDEWERTNTLDEVIKIIADSESIDMTNKLFVAKVKNAVLSGSSQSWEEAIGNAIQNEYTDYVNQLRNTFRISCFTTSPYQQLMWGGEYADKHTGFCVEYDVDPTDEAFNSIFFNLNPVIYCKSRPDVSEYMVRNKESLTEEKHWHYLFHGYLRKSIDWLYQNEWRLLKVFPTDTTNYNVPFYPISKVYLGCRMDWKQRSEIIEICKEKQIPYVGVKPAKLRFEMEECDELCENCTRHHTKGR